MIRPITCICMMLAAGSGLYLYQVKHRTEILNRTIEQTLKATDAVHERTRLLSAEWSLLNDPSRLSDMAAKFLTLRPVAPNQFVTMAELDKRLPPVQEYPPPGATPAPPTQPTPTQPITGQPPDMPIAQATPLPATQQASVEPAHSSAPEKLQEKAVEKTQDKTPDKTGAEKPAPERLAAVARPAQHVVVTPPSEPRAIERREPERREVASGSPQRSTMGAVAGPMATPVSNPVMLNPVLSRVMATNARPRSNRQDDYTANVSGTSPSSLGRSARVTSYPPINDQPHVSSALGGARNVLAPPVPVAAQAAFVDSR